MKARNREVILQELKTAVAEERKSTLRVLHLLRECEREQLYLEMGYPSLFEFTMKELGYSAGAAHRRLQSMRLLKDLPEFESKIEDGSLSLCVAAQTQSFFRQEDRRRKEEGEERLDLQSKEEVVRSVLGISSRECEARLAALSPEAILPKEKARALTVEQTLIQFVASRELTEKLEKLKSLLAHQNFEGRYDRLFEILADLALKKLDPETPSSAANAPKAKRLRSDSIPKANASGSRPSEVPSFPTSETDRPNASVTATRTPQARFHRTLYIPASIKRAVWKRDGGACTYRDPKTGRCCGSRHGIQYDHRQPYAWGGDHTVANLQLRCGQHNRYTFEQTLATPGRAS